LPRATAGPRPRLRPTGVERPRTPRLGGEAITRIIFATDFHGSDLCFRKFLGAAISYQAEVALVGGDITGKAIVPVIKQDRDTWSATYFGSTHQARGREELAELSKRISAVGFYPYACDKEEYAELVSNPERVDRIFRELMVERVRQWVQLAEQHLKPKGIRCFIMPGNDDIYEIDPVIGASDYVANPDERVLAIDDHHELISISHNNITPWKCHRDIPEEELYAKIDAVARRLTNPSNAVFCLHCPPYGTKIDQAPELDPNLKIVHKGGQVSMKSAGSTAVRRAIEQYQPLLGVHGHIHEGRGFDRIGRSLCLNPGSEYAEGILRAAVINLDRDKVKGYMLISG